jgi:hypothetical protein
MRTGKSTSKGALLALICVKKRNEGGKYGRKMGLVLTGWLPDQILKLLMLLYLYRNRPRGVALVGGWGRGADRAHA